VRGTVEEESAVFHQRLFKHKKGEDREGKIQDIFVTGSDAGICILRRTAVPSPSARLKVGMTSHYWMTNHAGDNS
jgi:hypothetical protein